ncbi:MAG: leucyl/phenylalanyl-tRNA--protein transferase [Pirellulales bacterium]
MTLLPRSRYFPPAEEADEHGIVLVGGDLRPVVLLDAYQHGIFPWPMWNDDLPMLWWSPDPRGVIEFDRFHVSRRLERTCRSGAFTVTSDQDFAGVVRGCATARGRRGSTWLTDEMIQAYRQLHRLGHAHSVEVWHEGKLAGGIYGVTIGGLFAGESMFHRVRDASKVALAHLVRHVERQGYRLFDVQQLNPHTASMGATEIPRREYLRRLSEVLAVRVEFGTIEA